MHLLSLLLYTEIATLGASVFSRSRINRSQMDISRGFAIPRLYNTHCKFCCHIEHTYLCVCVCLLCICDILWHTSTFPRHGLDQYSFQHFSHRLLLWWMMSSSSPLQDENLYWRPESIMPTRQATRLAIPSSSLAWPDRYFCTGALSPSLNEKSTLSMWHWSWEWLAVWLTNTFRPSIQIFIL